MNGLLSALLAALLALPAGQLVQLCKHESGPVHVFAGNLCDGTLSHGRDSRGLARHSGHGHGHRHDHGHHHSGAHSDHASPGEHHEPCTHETISTGDDLANAQPTLTVSPERVATLLSFEPWPCSVAAPSNVVLPRKPRPRGPPGLDDPLRQFATCVRHTV